MVVYRVMMADGSAATALQNFQVKQIVSYRLCCETAALQQPC